MIKFMSLLLCLFTFNASAAVGVPSIKNKVIYVNVGDDPTTAKNASVAGDTIIVGPGTYYNCSNLMKRGVNWELHSARLTWTNALTDDGYGIFDDRFIGGPTTNSITALGDSRLIYMNGRPTVDVGLWTYHNRTTSNGIVGMMGAVVTTNPLTKLTVTGLRVDMIGLAAGQGPSGIACIYGTNDFNYCSVYDVLGNNYTFTNYDETLANMEPTASSLSGLWWQYGRMTFKNSPMIQGRAYGVYSRDDLGTGVHDFFWDAAHVMGRHYSAGASNQNWRVWCSFDELVETNAGLAVSHLAGGRIYYKNFGKILSSDSTLITHGMDLSYPTELWMIGNKVTCKGRAFLINGGVGKGGIADLNIQHYEDLGGIQAGFECTGAEGRTIVNGGRMVITNGVAANVKIGATLEANNVVWNNAGTTTSNVCVMIATNSVTLRGGVIVGPAGKFSVGSTSTNQLAAYFTAFNVGISNLGLLGGSVTVTNTAVH